MKSAQWLKRRASHFIKSEAYMEAVPYLERLLKLSGTEPYDLGYAHGMLGEIYLQEGRHRMAREHLKASLDIGGEHSRGLMLLGQAYCGDGKLRRGRQILEQARRLSPRSEAVELSLGLCICMLGEFEEAAEVYERCIGINPDRPEAYIGLAQSLAGQENIDAAREVLRKAKKRLPLYLPLRLAIKELEKLEKARDYCEWVMEQDFYMPGEGFSQANTGPDMMAKTAMVEYGFPPRAIEKAVKLWQDFLRVSGAHIRQPEAWAAAIVYTFARILGRKDITQAILSEKFNCSKSNISSHFGRISRTLKIVGDDKRYGAPQLKK